MSLKIYTVVHHIGTKEYTTQVVAYNKIKASEFVDGVIMDVSDGENIREGMKVSSSGWDFSFIKPSYNSPSDSWVEHLKSINLTGDNE